MSYLSEYGGIDELETRVSRLEDDLSVAVGTVESLERKLSGLIDVIVVSLSPEEQQRILQNL